MTPADIDTVGNQALQKALDGEPGTKIDAYGTNKRADGTPADGYFEADAAGPNRKMIRVQGWYKEAPDGTKTISSHAPRYDKSWISVPLGDW